MAETKLSITLEAITAEAVNRLREIGSELDKLTDKAKAVHIAPSVSASAVTGGGVTKGAAAGLGVTAAAAAVGGAVGDNASDSISGGKGAGAGKIKEAGKEADKAKDKVRGLAGMIEKMNQAAAQSGSKLFKAMAGVVTGAYKAGSAVGALGRKLASLSARGLSAIGAGLSKIGSMAAGYVKVGILALGAAMTAAFVAGSIACVKYGAEMEQTRISFQTMMGDARKGNAMLAQLADFANVTPFSTEEVVNTGKKLMAFGLQAQDVKKTLTMLGDVSAGTGKPLEELGAIYGKTLAKGKADGETLNQLSEAGIPIIDELCQHFKVAKQDIFKMSEQGKISSADIQAAFEQMSGEGGRFGGLMEKQSQTLGGLWSTFTGMLQNSAAMFGEQIAPMIGEVVKKLIGYVEQLQARIKDGSALQAVADFATKAIDMVSKIVQNVRSAWGIIKGIFVNLGLIGKTIVSGLLGILTTGLGYAIQGVRTAINGILEAYNWAAEKMGRQKVSLFAEGDIEFMLKDFGAENLKAANEAGTDLMSSKSWDKVQQEVENANKEIAGWAKTATDFVTAQNAKAQELIKQRAADANADTTQDAKTQYASKLGGKDEKVKETRNPDQLARLGLYNFTGPAAAGIRLDQERNNLLKTLPERMVALFQNNKVNFEVLT